MAVFGLVFASFSLGVSVALLVLGGLDTDTRRRQRLERYFGDNTRER